MVHELSQTNNIQIVPIEFKQVIWAIISQEFALNESLSLIPDQDFGSMFPDILRSANQAAMLASFQQLGSQYPAQMYLYVAETLRRGEGIIKWERLSRNLGFSAAKALRNEVPTLRTFVTLRGNREGYRKGSGFPHIVSIAKGISAPHFLHASLRAGPLYPQEHSI